MAAESDLTMIPVIAPVPAAELAREMAGRQPLTIFRGLEIHSLHGDECPAMMREIGRLRETRFREVGAGRNVACDVDDLDFGPVAYRQLVVWDARESQLVAMYRYQRGALAVEHGGRVLRTHGLFRYSARFEHEIKPRCIELGRSVVNRDSRRHALGLFALWTGLYALLAEHPEVHYFFGNVSLYRSMQPVARDLLVAFLEHHYRPPEPVLIAHPALRHVPGPAAVAAIPANLGKDVAARIRMVRALIAPWGESIPPILQSYMSLSHDIWFGETACDADFGDALEIGIIVPVEAARRSGALARFARGRAFVSHSSPVRSPAG
jgi:hypothetical protein